MYRPELEGGEDKAQIEEAGCCEDLKAAYAYADKFLLRKYFAQPKKGEPQVETELKKETELMYNIAKNDNIREQKLEVGHGEHDENEEIEKTPATK